MTVESLAAALLGLSVDDRACLAALLLGQQADGPNINPATPDVPAGQPGKAKGIGKPKG